MYKLEELNEERYENFVRENKYKSHFLQSYAWGEFAKVKKGLTPYYLGLVDENNNIVAGTLLLQKHLPLKLSYFYAPRGFVLNYLDKDVFNEMTKEVIKYIKNKKAIFLKIDPDIIWRKYNYLDEAIELDYSANDIFEMIKKVGFKHLGFTKNFETNNPRYTFRIDLNQSIEDIENHFSKTTMQRIKKAEKLKTEVKIGTEEDLDVFCKLMAITEERKDFVSYDDDYYKTLYKMFNKNNKMTLFLGIVHLNDIVNTLLSRKKELNEELEKLPEDEDLSKSQKNKLKELNRQLDKVNTDIEKYNRYKEEYGNDITLNAHMIIEYGNKAWVLYAGNENILTETYSNYKVYYEHLKYCKDKGIEIYDQFGTIGDLSKDNPRLGLHEFKKKFGGDYVEFIGEFDYITKPFIYFIFTKLVPLYRKIVRKKAKKKIKNQTK